MTNRGRMFLALCMDCRPQHPPFDTKRERNRWVREHRKDTSHFVIKAGAIVETAPGSNVWRGEK